MKKAIILLTIISFFLIISGCEELPKEERTALEKLETMRKNWASLNLTDYEYVAGYSCFCGYTGPFTINITNNTLDTVYFTEQGDIEITYDQILELTRDLLIDSLFLRIEENIRRNPYSYNLDYDPNYFFPSESYFDFEKNAADEEVGYYITGFSF